MFPAVMVGDRAGMVMTVCGGNAVHITVRGLQTSSEPTEEVAHVLRHSIYSAPKVQERPGIYVELSM
jgi:hypothetical protein